MSTPVGTVTTPVAPPTTGGQDGLSKQDVSKLHQVAAQFEAVFLQELLKGAEPEDGEGDQVFGDGNAASTWRSLQHQQLAENSAGNLGIADLLVRELSLKAAK